MHQQVNRGYSLIQDSGAYSSTCGYCNNAGSDQSSAHGKSSHGMHAYRLTVYDYQELLDQGWRRSGKFLYKPNNKTTCCQQYTIRLDVNKFQPGKAHKRLLRKWEQFLAGQLQSEQASGHAGLQLSGGKTAAQQQPHQQQMPQQVNSSATQQGPKRTRQQSAGANGTSTKAATAAEQAGGIAANMQQQQQKQCQAAVHDVQSMLQQAVSMLCQQGVLPPLQQQHGLPAVTVAVPPQQKRNKLPAGTVMTSSCAHALAAAVRKAQQQHQQQQSANNSVAETDVTASGLAQALAQTFNSLAAAAAAAEGAQLCSPVTATAANGHINFASQQQLEVQQRAPQQQQLEVDSAHPTHPENLHQQQRVSQQPVLQEQQQQQQQSTKQHLQQHLPLQPQPQHHLELRMVPSQFIQEEYELYCKYQIQQHHDDPADLTPNRYRNFLVDTPLVPVLPPQQQAAPAGSSAGTQPGQAAAGSAAATPTAAGMPSCGYGSFHQQYWLDGKLVAVGVVDVLPRCLSSKYFFWDPDYAWLSLGRYGALREISWVQQAHAAGAASLQYYYLGYYIHTCPKMAYKAEYAPSELLCPLRQIWVTVDRTVRQALDQQPYVVLSDLPGVQLQPNLSVPRPLPAGGHANASHAGPTAAAGTAGLGPATGSAQPSDGSAMPVHSSMQGQMATGQPQRQALDAQLVFLLKQPVRWGVLRDSGMLDAGQVAWMEERLTEWREVVGEAATHLLYATPSDLLSFG